MAEYKKQLENKYGLPVYCQWKSVPSNFHTRTYYKELGINIPKTAKPDAIKGGGGNNKIYFLFDEENWRENEF